MIKNKIILSFLVIYSSIVSQSLFADASGPDFYQVGGDKEASMFADKDPKSKLIAKIPAQKSKLKNLGCKGLMPMDVWSKMNENQRYVAKQKIWCKVDFNGQQGWVQNIYLTEYAPLQKPAFDCGKATSSIEKLICQTPKLSFMDRQLNQVYTQALAKAKSLDAGSDAAVKNLKAVQRGWIKGRNECWKELDDKPACVEANYARRTAFLETKWALREAKSKASYRCEDGGEIVATFYQTKTLPSVAVEYGDNTEIMLSVKAASGSHYQGSFGRTLWIKNQEASYVWDQTKPVQKCQLAP